MENGEKRNSGVIHSVASVPVMSGGDQQERRDKEERKTAKNRRVSFAASSQFLEPINPFAVLGKKFKRLLFTQKKIEGASQCQKM
jgi:hypothetical protein